MLTGVRLLLVPVFLVALFVDDGQSTGWRLRAFGVFAVAAFTDRLDGELARRRGLVTAFGTIADPIADKALTGSALVGLSMLGLVPWWVTVVIMGRELGITLLRFWVLRHGIIPASRGGKAKTLVQAIAIGLYLLPLPELIGAETAVAGYVGVLLAIAVVLTVGHRRRLRPAGDAPARHRAHRRADSSDAGSSRERIEGLFALGGRDRRLGSATGERTTRYRDPTGAIRSRSGRGGWHGGADAGGDRCRPAARPHGAPPHAPRRVPPGAGQPRLPLRGRARPQGAVQRAARRHLRGARRHAAGPADRGGDALAGPTRRGSPRACPIGLRHTDLRLAGPETALLGAPPAAVPLGPGRPVARAAA